MRHVCPWWIGYLLASPLRRFAQDPAKLLAPYVREGMTALEPGPGMGFFTLDLARLAGPSGRVVVVDVQPKMLAALRRRAAQAGVVERIETRLVDAGSMDLDDLAGTVDFTLAFAVVHEFPSPAAFFEQVARAMKPGATLFLAEPRGHVTAAAFEAELHAARAAGFARIGAPVVKRSHAALLEKTDGTD